MGYIYNFYIITLEKRKIGKYHMNSPNTLFTIPKDMIPIILLFLIIMRLEINLTNSPLYFAMFNLNLNFSNFSIVSGFFSILAG